MYLRIVILFLLMLEKNYQGDFKNLQLQNARVKTAYHETNKTITTLLTANNIDRTELSIFLRIFKSERLIELWGKNKNDSKYKYLNEYSICTTSGNLGPKRKEGDGQMPEGFYHIHHFNPLSNFYLSLGVSYPNESDKILSDKKNPGGAIYIHGNCVTIGCFPITDEKIKELYIFAMEAKNNGQEKIPVHIFPCRMTEEKWKKLSNANSSNLELIAFWENIKMEYDYFENHKNIRKISVNTKGVYVFR